MSNLITKFEPSVKVDNFSREVEIDGRCYISGMEKTKLGYSAIINSYYVAGNLYLETDQTTQKEIRTPRLFNPFNKSMVYSTERKREFEIDGLITPTVTVEWFVKEIFKNLLGTKGLMINIDSARDLFKPIFDHYLPIIESANVELEAIMAANS